MANTWSHSLVFQSGVIFFVGRMPQDAQVEKRWTGGELLVCAVIQLLLVNVAYRIDRMKGAPYVSTASWAIIFGLGVRLSGCSILYEISQFAYFFSMEHFFLFHGIW